MRQDTKEQYENEMQSCIDSMEGLVPGTEEYKMACESFKILNEVGAKNAEVEQKAKDSKGSTVKDSIFKTIDVILGVANLLLPMVFYNKMTDKHMLFEKSGNIAVSPMFKSFIGKLHPTKKL